jgi:hypothetical protein
VTDASGCYNGGHFLQLVTRVIGIEADKHKRLAQVIYDVLVYALFDHSRLHSVLEDASWSTKAADPSDAHCPNRPIRFVGCMAFYQHPSQSLSGPAEVELEERSISV